jgi:hypothetical protein
MTPPPRDPGDPGPETSRPDDSNGADENGWNEPSAGRRRLYPVPASATTPGTVGQDPADQRADDPGPQDHNPGDPGPDDPGEIPWGNSPEELLDETLHQLGALTDQVRDLDKLVRADRDDQAGTGAGKYLRFRYERHPAADAEAAHAELARWVSWLVATYQLTDAVPPCWDRHDALAEELAGFYVTWQNVWADEGPYDAAVVWHEQLHNAVAARWPMWLRGARCSESCALDTTFADQAHYRWTSQATAGGGAEYRLTRTRQLKPPIPVPTKTTPKKGGKPGRATPKPAPKPGPTATTTSTPKSTPPAPTTGRTPT